MTVFFIISLNSNLILFVIVIEKMDELSLNFILANLREQAWELTHLGSQQDELDRVLLLIDVV